MNSQEAKYILQAYRHNGADATDPHFQEALAQVKRDPELERWLKEDQKLFQLVRRSLLSIPIPADLKTNILAGGKIVRPIQWWRQPTILVAAAVLAILLTWAGFILSRSATGDYASFRTAMTYFLDNRLDRLDEQANDVKTLQAWLAGTNAPNGFSLPPGLRGLPSLGCKVLDYHGNKVSLVCFRDGGNLVHLFVIDQPEWQKLKSTNTPQLARSGSWNTAGWVTDRQAFLLASKIGEDELRKYL